MTRSTKELDNIIMRAQEALEIYGADSWTYDGNYQRVVGSQEHHVLDVRGWFTLTRGCLNMEFNSALAIQESLGELLAALPDLLRERKRLYEKQNGTKIGEET